MACIGTGAIVHHGAETIYFRIPEHNTYAAISSAARSAHSAACPKPSECLAQPATLLPAIWVARRLQTFPPSFPLDNVKWHWDCIPYTHTYPIRLLRSADGNPDKPPPVLLVMCFKEPDTAENPFVPVRFTRRAQTCVHAVLGDIYQVYLKGAPPSAGPAVLAPGNTVMHDRLTTPRSVAMLRDADAVLLQSPFSPSRDLATSLFVLLREPSALHEKARNCVTGVVDFPSSTGCLRIDVGSMRWNVPTGLDPVSQLATQMYERGDAFLRTRWTGRPRAQRAMLPSQCMPDDIVRQFFIAANQMLSEDKDRHVYVVVDGLDAAFRKMIAWATIYEGEGEALLAFASINDILLRPLAAAVKDTSSAVKVSVFCTGQDIARTLTTMSLHFESPALTSCSLSARSARLCGLTLMEIRRLVELSTPWEGDNAELLAAEIADSVPALCFLPPSAPEDAFRAPALYDLGTTLSYLEKIQDWRPSGAEDFLPPSVVPRFPPSSDFEDALPVIVARIARSALHAGCLAVLQQVKQGNTVAPAGPGQTYFGPGHQHMTPAQLIDELLRLGVVAPVCLDHDDASQPQCKISTSLWQPHVERIITSAEKLLTIIHQPQPRVLTLSDDPGQMLFDFVHERYHDLAPEYLPPFERVLQNDFVKSLRIAILQLLLAQNHFVLQEVRIEKRDGSGYMDVLRYNPATNTLDIYEIKCWPFVATALETLKRLGEEVPPGLTREQLHAVLVSFRERCLATHPRSDCLPRPTGASTTAKPIPWPKFAYWRNNGQDANGVYTKTLVTADQSTDESYNQLNEYMESVCAKRFNDQRIEWMPGGETFVRGHTLIAIGGDSMPIIRTIPGPPRKVSGRPLIRKVTPMEPDDVHTLGRITEHTEGMVEFSPV